MKLLSVLLLSLLSHSIFAQVNFLNGGRGLSEQNVKITCYSNGKVVYGPNEVYEAQTNTESGAGVVAIYKTKNSYLRREVDAVISNLGCITERI